MMSMQYQLISTGGTMMTPVEWARFLRQANAVAGGLTGAGLFLLAWYLPAGLFLAMGLSHLVAEVRHMPYRTQDSVWLGIGLLLNLYAMTLVLKTVWMQSVH